MIRTLQRMIWDFIIMLVIGAIALYWIGKVAFYIMAGIGILVLILIVRIAFRRKW